MKNRARWYEVGMPPSDLTWEGLRELAVFRAENGCAISLYVSLDPSEVPTAGDIAARINGLLSNGEHDLGQRRELVQEQRSGLRADFARLRDYFANDFDRAGAHGAAVFLAGLDNVFRPLLLSEAVPDTIKVGPAFHLAPLVPLVGRADGAIVAVVGREAGHLYRLSSGRLHELADRSEDVPGRHDQGGRSQARFQRSIDEQARSHLRDVADELARQVRRFRADAVVVVGAEDTRAEFLDLLSGDVRSAVVGVTQAEAHAGPAELFEAAAPVLEQVRSERERASLARWREEASRGGRAAAGWDETLEAASDGRVDLLLYNEGVSRSAYQCPHCGRAATHDGSCPLDGTAMECCEDAIDLAIHQTLAHGGAVLAVAANRDLEPVEGIGALLRY